ncbi:LCP family protein [Yinghuangia soli]|uniref:LCP family protein n=1 Tax=Yinghuangia soli TaxID=2908204 RepID=A0AA41Q0F1_9ACTN|nr:LCP family protein [Yinghuangia soli]MCF2529270.1 LCP family protein [Yinghuangia soli]
MSGSGLGSWFPGPEDTPSEDAPPEGQWGPPPPAGRLRRVLFGLLAAAVLLAAVLGGTGWWLYRQLDGNIRTDDDTRKSLAQVEKERPKAAGPARNLLIMGSDYRPELGSARSDTTLLLHLSGDGRRALVVSVPRDLMVWIPDCARDGKSAADAGPEPDGGRAPGALRYEQFNWSFDIGGPACTIRTVERLTGVRIDHHMVLGFDGFTRLVDELGGVEVELPAAERDPNVGLDLPAGRSVLHGQDALAYVRARQYVGDGSDTNRMARQQEFMRKLAAKVRGGDVLLNPVRLYRVLDAATSAVTADAGLDSLDELYGLVERLRAVPEGNVSFVTVPRKAYPADPNRDVLAEPAAGALFTALRADRPYAPDSFVPPPIPPAP